MRRDGLRSLAQRCAALGTTVALFFGAVVSGCSSASDDTAANASTSAGLSGATTVVAPPTDSAAGSFASLVESTVGDLPGGVDVLRRLDGQVETIVAGVADAEGTELIAGQPFRVGSISKTFIATMVMQLVDEGRIELDQPLSSYLPDAALGGAVTVRQLLAHRSGLPNYTDMPKFFSDVYADLDHWYSPAEVLDVVADAPTYDPGRFAYSNTNYILLGQLIEALDERSLADSLGVRIAEPLGLTSTVLPTEAAPLAVMPVGAWGADLEDGKPDTRYDSIVSSAWAAGAIISTSDELLVFLDALFNGQLTSAESLAQMMDAQPATPGGYGLGLVSLDLLVLKGFGHSGSIPGFTSFMVYDPNTGDALIVLQNNPEIDTGPILELARQP